MNKKIAIIILFFFLAILQNSFLVNLFVDNTVPNIILVVIVIWSTKKDFKKNWVWAIVAGFIFDILSLSVVGLNVFLFFLVAYLTNYLSKRFLTTNEKTDFFLIMVLAIVGSLLNSFIHILFFQLTNFPFGIDIKIFTSLVFIKKLFFYLIFTGIVFIFIYKIQEKIENTFSRQLKKIIL